MEVQIVLFMVWRSRLGLGARLLFSCLILIGIRIIQIKEDSSRGVIFDKAGVDRLSN